MRVHTSINDSGVATPIDAAGTHYQQHMSSAQTARLNVMDIGYATRLVRNVQTIILRGLLVPRDMQTLMILGLWLRSCVVHANAR